MAEISPAQLALELRVSQTDIREYLQAKYGPLPETEPRWKLTSEQAADVRSHFTGHAASPRWLLEPGDVVLRRLIHETYGGQRYGGIATPVSRPEIFIFTDPKQGARFGYDQFEGLREDGSYAYTGEGQRGHQTFTKGNRALRDAAKDGKIIRLFRTKAPHATYVGAFTTGTPTYWIQTIPDVDNNPRDGIIFNLVPVDARADLLPAHGGELPPEDGLVRYSATPRLWVPPDHADVIIEADDEPPGDRVVSRVEFELQVAFGEWLAAQDVKPMLLPLRAGSRLIQPDLYVPDWKWIVEAKRSNSRNHVRTAIGQVLDYAHMARRSGLDVTPVILLPGMPEQDLVELMHSLGITVVTRVAEDFEISPPSAAT